MRRLNAELAEHAEKKTLRILGVLCVLGGQRCIAAIAVA